MLANSLTVRTESTRPWIGQLGILLDTVFLYPTFGAEYTHQYGSPSTENNGTNSYTMHNHLANGSFISGQNNSAAMHAHQHHKQSAHFLYTCPLAQTVWDEFRTLLDLPHQVSFQQALYSMPSSSSSVLGRTTGFKLQAGHAIALYTLWTVHTQAIFDDVSTNPAAIRLR